MIYQRRGRWHPTVQTRDQQSFLHPLTDHGLTGFIKDWEKAREVLGHIPEPAGARKAKP